MFGQTIVNKARLETGNETRQFLLFMFLLSVSFVLWP